MKIKKVVYDVDDVLWGLNVRVAKLMGIDIKMITHFKVWDNKLLSSTQHDQMLSIYHDNKTFENIVWHDGIEELPEFEKAGVEVCINSNCLTERMAVLKTEQLLAKIPLKKENIKCNVIDTSTCTKKKIDEDTDILVEDSPYNIAQSPAKINILISCPWNMTDEAREIMKGKSIIRVNSLKEANRIIRLYVDGNEEKVG